VNSFSKHLNRDVIKTHIGEEKSFVCLIFETRIELSKKLKNHLHKAFVSQIERALVSYADLNLFGLGMENKQKSKQ
jgi:hypothetical protein